MQKSIDKGFIGLQRGMIQYLEPKFKQQDEKLDKNFECLKQMQINLTELNSSVKQMWYNHFRLLNTLRTILAL